MLRNILRVLAVLFLLGGLLGSGIAGYLLMAPGDEDTLYQQRQKESVEKYEESQAATSPGEKARLLKESQEAEKSARVWGEGARVRRGWHQVGMGVAVAVCLFSCLVLGLTFIVRKRSFA